MGSRELCRRNAAYSLGVGSNGRDGGASAEAMLPRAVKLLHNEGESKRAAAAAECCARKKQ